MTKEERAKRIEQSNREALGIITTERSAREHKTAKLRELRLAKEAAEPKAETEPMMVAAKCVTKATAPVKRTRNSAGAPSKP